MKYNTLWKCVALCFLAVCPLLPAGPHSQAQTQTSQPANILWILQEDIKPTTIEAFQKLQRQYIDVYRKAKFSRSWLGLAPIADRNSEIVFLWGFNSVSDMQRVFDETNRLHGGPFGPILGQLDRQATAFVTGQRESVAAIRPDLSVRVDVAAGAMRTGSFLQVLTVRLQPGKEQEWTNAMTEAAAALNKSGSAQQSITYQVTSGEAPGTFLVMYPSKSPDDITASRERAIVTALGSDRAQRHFKVMSETVLKEERALYAIDPKLSFQP